MLTFLIPLLLGTILGFLIRGKPSDTFAITTGKRVAWGVGIAFGGVAIGTPIGLSISSTTGPQIAGLIGAGLGLGVFNILSIENATYKKWSDKNALAWLVGGVVGVGVVWFVLSKQIPDFSEGADNASASPAEVPPDQPAQVADVPNSYLGVTLGDSEQQVRYALGEPAKRTPSDGTLLFTYGDEHSGVWLSSTTKRVQQVGCQFVETCPPFLGLKIGDDETKVKMVLGARATERFQEGSGNDSSLMKVITLSNANEVSFYLERKKVIAIMLRVPKEPRS